MRMHRSMLVVAVAALTLLSLPLVAGAQVPKAKEATSTFTYTKNMKPLGYSVRVVEKDNTQPSAGSFPSPSYHVSGSVLPAVNSVPGNS